ncbi:MAG: ribonuclease E/G [Boseongicola sp.]|nr:ribonuclease E/G [Boseongicola sp.]
MKGVIHAYGQVQGREAAGLIIDGKVEDFVFDTDAPRPGAIYRAKTVRPVKGQGGMFVETPDGSAFLRNAKGLSVGRHILVQVSGYAEAGKATPVTDRLLFKNKYAIVTPGKPGINIARSIKDEDRRVALREVADVFSGHLRGCGVILRSSAATAELGDVQGAIESALDAAFVVLEDTGGSTEKLIEGPDVYEFAYREWPTGTTDGDIEECFESAIAPSSALPGGGKVTVQSTSALVAVDVDTGGDTSPAAGLKANIAAAKDLPRLLRLKGLGGQVVIDFAPMPKKNRRGLEQALQSAFRSDSIETALIGWTKMGLFEMSRKKARPALHEVFK